MNVLGTLWKYSIFWLCAFQWFASAQEYGFASLSWSTHCNPIGVVLCDLLPEI